MITTITGKNSFLAQQKLGQIKQAFIEEFGDSAINELDGEVVQFDQVQQHVMSQGLFSQNSLVVLRDVSSNKHLQEQLIDLLDGVPSDTHLVIYDTNLDRRTTFFKAVKKGTEFVDCAELEERDLVQWARDELEKSGLKLGFSEAQYLVQRVNLDQWLLFHELEKLANVEGPITKELIQDMVDESFTESIFNLLDDAFGKRADKALSSYRNMLRNKVESHYVFSMLVWQLHILLLVAYAKDVQPATIAKDNKLSPFVVQKTSKLLNKTSRAELKSVVGKASEIDSDSKTKAAYNMDAAVDLLIAHIAT